MKAVTLATFILAALLAAFLFAADGPSSTANAPTWSPKAAAAYLDGREDWWVSWNGAARDHQTFCVSCHTVLPYAMARPSLRAALAEQSPSPQEQRLLANVTKRVRMWKEVEPFYSDEKRGAPKTVESRGTESVLNAVILVGYDAPTGKLSADARLALDNMWATQLKTGEARGAWSWLQFHNSPWEGDSQYFGAALAALVVGTAPGHYRSSREIRDGMAMLREYLAKNRDSQILINRLILLWASTKVPHLLSRSQQKAIIQEALAKQQADGGFSLSSFVGGWKRHDGTPLVTKSDGYATGVVTYVLQQAGVKRDQSQVKRGLDWLRSNQDMTDGRWVGYSLNMEKHISPQTNLFMSDAATAYAVLALTRAQ